MGGDRRESARALLFDTALTLALCWLALQFTEHLNSQEYLHGLVGRGAVLAVAVAGCAVLVVRRRLPRTVLLVSLAATTFLSVVGGYSEAVDAAVVISVYTVAARSRPGWAVLGVGTYAAGNLWQLWTWPELPFGHSLVTGLLAAVIAAGAGFAHQRSLRHAARLEGLTRLLEDTESRLTADRASERDRIARELHDIGAGHVGVVVIRAGLARALMTSDPEQAKQALEVIEQASRGTLDEIRHLVRTLRHGTVPEPAVPPPGLARVAELASTMRSTGLDLEVVERGAAYSLPPDQDLAAYRIVQEALTNVLKHAGQVRTKVIIDYQPEQLALEVFNERVRRPPSGLPGTSGPTGELIDRVSVAVGSLASTGHGLIGMRERVASYGGRLEAAPVPGGFRVHAELPVDLTEVAGIGADGVRSWTPR